MIRLVLFDIDGTLIQTGGAGRLAFDRALRSEFKLHNGTDGVNFAGRTDTSLVREIFRQTGIDPSPKNFHRFFDSYVFWLDHTLHQTSGRTCPHAHEFVAEVAALPDTPLLGLLTGNLRLGAEIKLRHYLLWDHFRTGAFADDHEDRNQIAAVARQRGEELLRTSLRGEEILVVGDTPLDIACARAIGAKVLAVATGGSTVEELENHRPDWIAADFREISPRKICR